MTATLALAPAPPMRLMVVERVSRSLIVGRQGTRIRSAAWAAAMAASAARGGVSMMIKSAPFSRAVARALGSRAGWIEIMTGSALRRSPHLQAVACGSRSMTATFLASLMAAMASDSVSVVLPLPPFWLRRAITFIRSPVNWLECFCADVVQCFGVGVFLGWCVAVFTRSSVLVLGCRCVERLGSDRVLVFECLGVSRKQCWGVYT